MVEAHAETTSIPSPSRSLTRSPSWIPVVLISLWLAVEIGRPPYPLKIPLLCSVTLAIYWITAPKKLWDPVIVCILGFLLTGWIGVPFASNQYSAFWTCYTLTVVIVCICLPAAHFMKNMAQIHLFVGSLLAATAYVGLFAVTHSGFGPSGSGGGQDENYVAAAMVAVLPFSYFGLSATRSFIARLLFMTLSVVCLLATVLGFSRGGFLGIAVVGLFCFWYSPRKLMAIIATIIGVLAIVMVAPDSYWDEVQTIGDTSEGTADLRIELWTIATRQFLDNPIFGVGPSNFRWRIEDYETEEQIAKLGRSLGGSAVVHSTYFEILSELGGAGSGFFLAMLYFAFRDLRRVTLTCEKILDRQARQRGQEPDPELMWARSYALAFQGGLIGYLLCSAFISTTYYYTIWLMCASSVALNHVAAERIRTHIRGPVSAKPGRAMPRAPVISEPESIPSISSTSSGHPTLSDLLGSQGPTSR